MNCSVHIKVHVPEIIKKHTHVRTVYKHHFKAAKPPKPPKYKYSKSTSYYDRPRAASPLHHIGITYTDRRRDRRTNSGKSGRSSSPYSPRQHDEYAPRPVFQGDEHLVPAASEVYEDRTASSDSKLVQQWQHDFRQLNQRHAEHSIPQPLALTFSSSSSPSKRAKKVRVKPLAATSSELYSSAESTERAQPLEPLDYRFFEHFKEDPKPYFQDAPFVHDARPEAPVVVTTKAKRKKPTGQANRNIPGNHSPQHRPSTSPLVASVPKSSRPHQQRVTNIASTSAPPTSIDVSNFKPPRLLKITEQDIRQPKKPKSSRQQSSRGPQFTNKSPEKSTGAPSATDWSDYAVQHHPYPEYIHAVAAALKTTRPAVVENYNDGRHKQQESPASASASEEEFLPMQNNVPAPEPPTSSASGSGYAQYNPDDYNIDNLDPHSEQVPSAFEADTNVDNVQTDGSDESNESPELGPLSFDEVPYQTFTKRKNLLRNAHRE